MIRAVFFDIGNTLFFYNYEFLSNLLKERFDIDCDPRELEAVHYSLGEAIERMVKEIPDHDEMVKKVYAMWFSELDIDAERIPRIIEVIDSHPFPHLFWARMGDRVQETLDWLKARGIKMGVISNAEGQVRRLIEHVGLNDYFDVILDSKVVGAEKPDVRIFQKALKAVDVRPHEAVHIGDLVGTDIQGARQTGMIPVLVDREDRYPDIDCLRVRLVHEVITLPIFREYVS